MSVFPIALPVSIVSLIEPHSIAMHLSAVSSSNWPLGEVLCWRRASGDRARLWPLTWHLLRRYRYAYYACHSSPDFNISLICSASNPTIRVIVSSSSSNL